MSTSSALNIVIKPTAGGSKFTLQVEPNSSIEELKEEVAKHCGYPGAEQRLIYKGQILKDELTIASYGIENDHVLHLVRGRPPAASSGPSAGAAAATSPASATGPSPNASAAPDLGSLGGMFGGVPGLGGAAGGDPQQMQNMMQQMMNSPMMQAMLDNPEVLQTMLQGNPQVRQIVEANPEFGQMLNDPEMLRQSMRLAANPALMAQQMRNTDQAMTNIESHPEGFNALRRMYETVQEPLMNATSEGAAGADAGSNPFAALFQPPADSAAAAGAEASAPPTPGAPNSAPLPNPWALPAASATPPASSAGGASGLPDVSQFGLGGLGGLGSGGATASAPQMSAIIQAMQNPAMQQAMQQMMSTPGMMEQMLNMNPQMRAAVEGNPQLRATLNDPNALRELTNPQNLQAMLQMQQAMQQLSGGGMPGGAQGGAAPGGGMPDFASMMGMMGGVPGGFGGAGGGAPPVANPEEAYATQIQQLVDMGFFDRDANVQALQATSGNVNAAVERLLAG